MDDWRLKEAKDYWFNKTLYKIVFPAFWEVSYKNKNARADSFSAWVELNCVLKKISGKTLNELALTYSTRGKPLINDGNVSLSHSSGVVAVGQSNKNFGVDIEKVNQDASKYQSVAKKLGVTAGSSELYLKWTEVESASKLNDKFSLSFISFLLHVVLGSGGVTTVAGPVGVEELTAGHIGTLVGVSAEVVTLSLQQICRQLCAGVAVKIAQRRGERRHRNT